MNEPKFTPGPWVIVIPPQGPDEIRSADGSAELICEFPFGAGADADSQDAANANLIAAAPELYEALECLVRAGIGNSTDYALQAAAMQMARAALAKAAQS